MRTRRRRDAVINISDTDVTREYFKETGGIDSGLNILASLKKWRSPGWKIGKRTYAIRAFAEVNYLNPDEVRQAIYANVGVGLGLNLPIAAQQQIDHGQPWYVTSGPDSVPGSWGGHYVYVPAYTKLGPVCVTWGQKQQMTWAWFAKYCDEAYAMFDAKNRFKTGMTWRGVIARFLKAA